MCATFVGRCKDGHNNDAGRQEGEGSEQADVPFTLGFTLGNPGEGCNAAEPYVVDPSPGLGDCSRASRLSGLIAGFAQGACTMPFTAAKLGAVHASVIVVVRGRREAGSWKLGSSACAKTSHAGMRQPSNA